MVSASVLGYDCDPHRQRGAASLRWPRHLSTNRPELPGADGDTACHLDYLNPRNVAGMGAGTSPTPAGPSHPMRPAPSYRTKGDHD